MVLAWRLLGSFPGASGPQVRSLGVSGFWNSVASPRGAEHNGKTYLDWCTEDQDIYAGEYVHATHALSTPVLLASGVDAVDGAVHLGPAILVRSSDHRLIATAVANGGTHNPAVWTSTNPEDATAWPASDAISPGGVYTYAGIFQLNGVINDPIYWFGHHWSGGVRRLVCFKSTDGGATWGSMVAVLRPAFNTSIFTRLSANDTRIDIYTTDSARASPPSAVYHYIFEGDVLYDSEMNAIPGSSPFLSNTGTLVEGSSSGSVGACAATYDSLGNPSVALYVDLGSTVRIRRGIWDGSVWQVDTVVDDVGGLIGSNPNISLAAMADLDPDTMYVPVKVGSFFELFQYVTTDGGTTWSGIPITSGSAADNAMPECPIGATAGCRVIWGQGNLVDDFTFDFTMMAYGT